MDRIDWLDKLFSGFPEVHFVNKEKTIVTYLDRLKDVSDDELALAVNYCLDNCTYFPRIANVKEVITKLRNTLPSWDVVEKEITKHIYGYNPYTPTDTLPWSKPQLKELFGHLIRGIALGDANDITFGISQCRKVYEAYCKDQEFQTGIKCAEVELLRTENQTLIGGNNEKK